VVGLVSPFGGLLNENIEKWLDYFEWVAATQLGTKIKLYPVVNLP
jgi:hypothetical protein